MTMVVLTAVSLISTLSGLAVGFLLGMQGYNVRAVGYKENVDKVATPSRNGKLVVVNPPRSSSTVLRGKR